MDPAPVLRSRIAAAAVGATVLGLSAALVPSVSTAVPVSTVPAASSTVLWTDSATDFAALPATATADSLTDRWYGAAYTAFNGDGTVTTSSIDTAGTFGPDGFTLNQQAPVALAHGFETPLQPADLPAALRDAHVDATGNSNFAVFVQYPGTDEALARFAASDVPSGLDGVDTLWGPDGTENSTADFVAQLEQQGATIVGYGEYLGLSIEGSTAGQESAPTDESTPNDESTPDAAPGDQFSTLAAPAVGDAADPAAGEAAAAPAAIAAAPASLASITFADTTTYLTPQPTAALTVGSASVSATQATTTGTAVSGTGFAPGETVTVGLVAGQAGNEVPGVTFVADADGNVSGTVVLPTGLAPPGSYELVLLGRSSAQRAAAALTITADPAAVAVAVPAKATFTG